MHDASELREQLALAGIRGPIARVFRAVAALVSMCAVVAFFGGALSSPRVSAPEKEPRAWRAGEAPAWAERVFTTDLPALAIFANARDGRLGAATIEASQHA